MNIDELSIWLTIGMAALITYLLRAGGLLLSDKLPQTGKFNQFMKALPGTILLSLVAPGIFSSGPWGMVAAVGTGFFAYKTGNVFLSMTIGMLVMLVQRQVLT